MTTKPPILMSVRHAEQRGMDVRGFAALFVMLLCIGCGPIGPFSGGRLSGDDGDWPKDWSHVADVKQVQLETVLEDPYSVNVWLVAVDREAYLATSLLMGTEIPEEREWVRNIAVDPRVRIRVEGIVYSARLETVADSSVKARVFEAYQLKYPELKAARGEAARFYRVVEPGAATTP